MSKCKRGGREEVIGHKIYVAFANVIDVQGMCLTKLLCGLMTQKLLILRLVRSSPAPPGCRAWLGADFSASQAGLLHCAFPSVMLARFPLYIVHHFHHQFMFSLVVKPLSRKEVTRRSQDRFPTQKRQESMDAFWKAATGMRSP